MFSKILAGSTIALSLGQTLAAVQFGGVNIAGFDFGCTTDGTCDSSTMYPPTGGNNPDGAGQMGHFAQADRLNMFRLPVAWQYLVNNQVGGTLDPIAISTYDGLVQSCLNTGAHCIIDIHNYARWNGQIIGQGGPSDEQFASLWSQLATKYSSETNIVFGIMNEPHDLDMPTWANTVQAAVTAIRNAGATSQMCLLPGTDYTSAGAFATASGPALSAVKNLDASTENLVFDVHEYMDADFSGTAPSCVTNHINDAFSPLATYLRQVNRQAILSETGGGSSDASCLTDICATLDYLNTNSDVFLGYVGWAAGSFDTSYVLSLTPSGSATTSWTDQPLMAQCFAAKFGGMSASPSNAGSKKEKKREESGKVVLKIPDFVHYKRVLTVEPMPTGFSKVVRPIPMATKAPVA